MREIEEEEQEEEEEEEEKDESEHNFFDLLLIKLLRFSEARDKAVRWAKIYTGPLYILCCCVYCTVLYYTVL